MNAATPTNARSGAQHDNEPLLTQKHVARMLGISPRSLEAWRVKGEGPAFIRLTKRCVRYRRSEVEAWLEQRKQAA